jgi:hypothetical protein
MVNIVAREIARPWGEEAARIRKIMASKPALSAPRGDGKGFLRAQEWLASREAEKAAEIESRRWTPDPAKQQAEVLRAWAAMGIEPPALAPGKAMKALVDRSADLTEGQIEALSAELEKWADGEVAAGRMTVTRGPKGEKLYCEPRKVADKFARHLRHRRPR